MIRIFNRIRLPEQLLILSSLLILGIYQPAHAKAVEVSRGLPFSTLERTEIAHAGNLVKKPQWVQKGRVKRRSSKKTGGATLTTSSTQQQILQSLHARKNIRLQRSKGKNQPNITLEQKEQLQQLVSAYSQQTPVEASFNQHNGAVTLIKGRIKPQIAMNYKGKAKHQAVASAFMLENSALLKLDNPAQELKLQRSNIGRLGKAHLRYQQQYHNVPIWGKDIFVHMNDNDEIYLFQGTQTPTPRGLNTIPSITSPIAIEAVRRHLNVGNELIEPATSELMIYTQNDGTSLLTFKVTIKPSIDQRWIYFIDANTQEVVHRINNIHHAGSVVTASGMDAFGIPRTFDAWSENGQFYQINPTIPLNDPPFNPIATGANSTGDTFIYDIQNRTEGLLNYTGSIQQNSGWDGAGVSAAYNTQLVYDYFLNTFNRKSIDDNNQNLFSVIHFGSNYPNAFWNGTYMVYGDGDNTSFSSLAGCLDVAAHEMTHGIIEHTATLIYENQSGALNESWSDFFGAMVDRDDWLMGEDCVIRSPGYLRNMGNPAQGLSGQPTKMSQYQNLPNTQAGDWGGVHINSGIPNRAAYLLAEGLTVDGLGHSIGRAKTEQIWYRALSTYLQASSQFIDARRATIQSAEDLYGTASSEAAAVAVAWDTVEVTDTQADIPNKSTPTPTTPLAGSDGILYLYPKDGTHDKPYDPSEQYDLYWQVIPDNFSGYDANQDYGPLNSGIDLFYTRPAAYTDTNGTVLFYVGSDYNLYSVNVDGSNHQQVTTSGDIYSITISPDGRYFVYTSTGASDNTIYVLNLLTEHLTTHLILPPSYQEGGAPTLNTILYPDSVAFDYTSNRIVFDALNCIPSPSSSCQDDSGGYYYWSIGILNLSDDSLFYPFPNQNPNINLAYPSFATNNNFVIALDKQDWSNFSTNGTILSHTMTVNLETQTIREVANPNLTANTWGVWGVPSFFGDDNHLVLQGLKEGIGGTTYRIPIDSTWAASGPIENLNAYDAAMPIMHRTGVRQLTATLELSKTSLVFGINNVNTTSEQILTLRNTGNRDIDILGISLANTVFTHNGTNTLLPHGQKMDIQVRFSPSVAGSYNDTLIIKSDADTPELNVALSGQAVSVTDTDGDGIPNAVDPDDDNDGLPDTYEDQYAFLNPLIASDAALDRDKDGLTNLQEYIAGSDPTKKDTDRDGLSDKYELDNSLDPTDGFCPSWACGGLGGWRHAIPLNRR